ncbi:uncharacterized protein LOC141904314 [Tubulanus polymorphus]|uniref:uncharacterized protein LOC141904314 n=1 Tax=Tubulanus polymorphus TaxID=672921 RepID=UPI003DA62BB6
MLNAKQVFKNSSNDQESVERLVDQWSKDDLLFCYQSSWQQRLMARYGNDLCLMDATYRTLKYALPLFFICVRTNVNYTVVGTFLTEHESEDSIKEAPGVLKAWNPKWYHLDFLTDFSRAEINAVEAHFPDSEVRLCSFHRKKAWDEWLSKRDHNITEKARRNQMTWHDQRRVHSRNRPGNEQTL